MKQEALLNHLVDTYGLEGNDATELQSALLEIASRMADENLEEAMDGLVYELEGIFLEGFDGDTIRKNPRNLLMNSVFYTLSRCCELEPMDYLEDLDFIDITDFNNLSVLTFLGNATSQLVEPVLVDIGQTIRKIYLEEAKREAEKTVANENDIGYNRKQIFYDIYLEVNCDKACGDFVTGRIFVLHQGNWSASIFSDYEFDFS
jgi:hypothetical protein